MNNKSSFGIKINKTLFLISFIFVIGLLLRLYHLGTPSLWCDEIHTSNRVNYSFIGTIVHLIESPFPPFYYMAVNSCVKMFGNNSEFALRFPSFLVSTLTIPAIYKMGKELFNKEAGLIAALLLSISPYAINYAQDAKPYAMFWFFSIPSFLFFYRFLIKNDKNSLLFYVVSTVLCVYTMYSGLLFIIAQNIIFFLLSERTQIKRWLLGQLAIALLFSPWVASCVVVFSHSYAYMDWLPKIDNYMLFFREVFLLITGSSFGLFVYIDAFIYACLIMFVFIEAVFIFIKCWRKELVQPPINYFLLCLWVVIPVFICVMIDHSFCKILYPRYIGFLHIPLILLSAAALYRLPSFFKRILLFILVSITFASHLLPYYKDNLKIDYEDWRGLCADLSKKVSPDDIIFNSADGKLLQYYFKKEARIFPSFLKETMKFVFPSKKNIIIIGKMDSILFINREGDVPNLSIEGYYLAENLNYRAINLLIFKPDDSRTTYSFTDARDILASGKADQVWELKNDEISGLIRGTDPDSIEDLFLSGQCERGRRFCYLFSSYGARSVHSYYK